MQAGWKASLVLAASAVGLVALCVAPALADPGSNGVGSGSSGSTPAVAHACGNVSPGYARCHAVQLLHPSSDWHPGPSGGAPASAGASPSSTPAPPSSGYYPGDLQSAYGLASAAASFAAGPSAPTVAIVDAYNDPNAVADLTAYRTSLSQATDPNTGQPDGSIPPLCTSGPAPGCDTFTEVNQSGGTSLPSGNTGWSEEISLDLDMVSAVCPACNITLVEASTNSFSNLMAAVSYAKSLKPAAVTNSYGGSEWSSESSYNGTYSYVAANSSSGTPPTAVTAATGDSSYGTEFPATAPGTTAVGGTSLSYSGFGSTLAWAPQTVWYNSSSSGAGAGCSSYESLPSWQALAGVYNNSGICNGRQIGDVSAVADPYTGVAVYDTYGLSGWSVFGGTSASTQIIGAVYALAAGTATMAPAPSAFYTDTSTNHATGSTTGLVPVTSGSDGSCGNYLCNAADALSSGYNGPAGLGTPSGVGAFTSAPPAPPAGSLSFSPTSVSFTAGGTSSGLIVVATSSGSAINPGTVTLSTSSSTGGFSTSSAGPFSPSTTLTFATGTTSSPTFYYHDTSAGSPTITASAANWTSGTMTATVGRSSTPMTVTVSAGGATKSGPNWHVTLSSTTTVGNSGVSGATVTLKVYSGACSPSETGNPVTTSSTTTSPSGTASWTFSSRSATTWCAVVSATDPSYAPGSGQTTFST